MLLDFNNYSIDELIAQCLTMKAEEDELAMEIVSFLQKWNEVNPVFSIFSSGSTGDPKELFFTKESLITSAEISIQTFDLQRGDVAFLCLPLNFVAGKLMLVRSIVGRLKLKIEKPSSNPLKELSENIDFAAFTPFQISSILDEDKDKLGLISTIILGGSKVSNVLEERLKGSKATIYETFGMSETLTHCAIRNISSGEISFKVLKGFSWIVNKEGCIEISAKHLPQSPIRTNDIVKRIDSTHFTWLGRKDNVINSGGLKIIPELVERKINSVFPFTVIVAKEQDELLGEKAILYIQEVNRKGFDKASYDRIPFNKYEKPKVVRFIATFPSNKNGKIDRKLLNG